MKINKLFADITGMPDAESERAKQRAMAALLAEEGYPVEVATVRSWALRDNIPTPWLMHMLKAAESRGKTVNLTDYN